jgi:hypothetical protein
VGFGQDKAWPPNALAQRHEWQVRRDGVSKTRCPLLLARHVAACFFFARYEGESFVAAEAVGKWESRVFCGIPKRSVFSTAFRPFCLSFAPANRPVFPIQYGCRGVSVGP